MFEKLRQRQTNVRSNLAKQRRGDVSASVKGHRSAPAVRMAILPMRTTLPNFGEPKPLQDRDDLARFEDRSIAH
jgi:hypothetical protein